MVSQEHVDRRANRLLRRSCTRQPLDVSSVTAVDFLGSAPSQRTWQFVHDNPREYLYTSSPNSQKGSALVHQSPGRWVGI